MARTRYDEKHMMTHPNDWPVWPYLPVKDRNKDRIGITVEQDIKAEVQPVIYLTNIFNLPTDLTEVESVTYSDFDALLDDGWVVD